MENVREEADSSVLEKMRKEESEKDENEENKSESSEGFRASSRETERGISKPYKNTRSHDKKKKTRKGSLRERIEEARGYWERGGIAYAVEDEGFNEINS